MVGMRLWQMSFYGGALILVIALIRRGLQERIPREAFLALWAVAVLRLLVPFAMCSGFNVYAWAEDCLLEDGGQEEILEGILSGLGSRSSGEFFGGEGNRGEGIGVLFSEEEGGTAAGVPQESKGAGLEYGFLKMREFLAVAGKGIYWIGFMASALFYLVTYVKCWKEFRFSLPVRDTFVLEWEKGLSSKRKVSVRQSEAVAAPVTYGIFHPVILLPKERVWEDTRQLEFALEHEAEHIRHFDAAKKLLLVMAACIHWFNPLVWRMVALANKDMELACDGRVIRRYGLHSKSAYAYALIHMEEKRCNWMAFGNRFSDNRLEERIVAIVNMKKQTAGAIMAAVVMVTGVATVFAIAPDREEGAAAQMDGQGMEPASDEALLQEWYIEEGAEEGSSEIQYVQTDGEGKEADAAASEDSGLWENATKQLMYNISVNEDFADYEKFGLSYDLEQGWLLYQNEKVGYFKDKIRPNTYRRFHTEEGTVGIVVARDPAGRITGLYTGTVQEVMEKFAGRSVTVGILEEGENDGQVTVSILEE